MQKKTINILKNLFFTISVFNYIKTIYVSGSAARMNQVKGSDIDITIIYDNILYGNVDLKHIEITQNKLKDTAKSMGYNLHIQPPRALSDFWDLLRSGEPWILTELESAIVLHDPSELIEPLKILLEKHQLYKKEERASLLIDRAKIHFQNAENILFSDALFHLTDSAVSSTQAILMYFDRFSPYNELPKALKNFVNEGLMDSSNYRFFVLLIKLYNMDPKKRRTYCTKHKITLDLLIDGSLKFLERIEYLFELLEHMQKKNQSIKNYKNTIELMGRLMNKKDISDEELILAVESKIERTEHKIPHAYINTLKRIIHMKNLANAKRFEEISSKEIHEANASLKYLERLVEESDA